MYRPYEIKFCLLDGFRIFPHRVWLIHTLDSCHSRVIRSQQNLYPKFPPTAVVKLLQYSGLGSNTGMSFLRTNDLSEVKNDEFGLDFKVVIKTGGLVV